MIVEQIIQVAALSRDYLDKDSRRAVIDFIRSRWNRDGGVRGRDRKSDLYYTVFALICMRALKGPMPLLRLWKYARSFGDGASLDVVHLFCLIRLHSIFPMSFKTRKRLKEELDSKSADSAYDMFFKVVMADYLKKKDQPDVRIRISASDTTPNLAAAVVVNHTANPEAEELLLNRFCPTGGFCASPDVQIPDLLSTATALFALHTLDADFSSIRSPCFDFIESLWRESGGFAGHVEDRFEDTEYTFYALLSIGCLMA